MYAEQRVIYDWTDISKDVNDFRQGSVLFEYDSTKYLYIASIYPFNNIWLDFKVLNATARVPSVQIWYNNAWTDAVDVIDETAGATKSGRIQWGVHYDKSWTIQDKSEKITELSTFKIYNMYWCRIKWDGDFDALTELQYVGQKFSSDIELFSFYPDLQQTLILQSYGGISKTDWTEQHYMAADQIVRDLKKRGIIKSRSQLLDHSILADASCHRVAWIVYTAMGPAYLELKQEADKAYLSALNLDNFAVDKNGDGKLSQVERTISIGFMSR